MNNKCDSKKYIAYGMYILSLFIFGTNGFYVSHISLGSSQIVLMRTLIGGALLSCLVLIIGGAMFGEIKKQKK